MSTRATTSAVRPTEPARQMLATFDNYADTERADVEVAGRGLQLLAGDTRKE